MLNNIFAIFSDLTAVGLFDNLTGETIQDKYCSLQKKINASAGETWNEFNERLHNASEVECYLSIVSYSEQAWSHDMEADVCEENQIYSGLLKRLAKLSKGEFTFSDPKEDWSNVKAKEVKVSFTWKDQRISWELKYLNDWIDPMFFKHFMDFTKESLSGEFFYFNRNEWHRVMLLWFTKEQSEALE